MLIFLTVIVSFLYLLKQSSLKGLIDKIFPTRRIFETAAEVSKRDVPLESHFVTTADGYVLNIFRMRYSEASNSHVALLQHGMMSNSTDWVAVDRSIAFQLVEKGWDVWLGNNRGNIYSREHVALPTDSQSFYSYSYHELGLYDIPAVVDYILEKTSREKIVYIGHSQGTSQFFAMATLLPEMNSKISAMFALAPVSSLAHSHRKLQFMYTVSVLLGTPRRFFEALGYYRMRSYFPRFLLPLADLTSPIWVPIGNLTIGNKILKQTVSYPSPNIVQHSFEFCFLQRLRNGVSWQELEHFSQSLSGKHYFSQLDYGTVKNLEIYGTPHPPPYNLRKIKTHISLVWGQKDDYTAPIDLVKLLDILKYKAVLRIPNYKHLDFIASTMHNDLILDHICEISEIHDT